MSRRRSDFIPCWALRAAAGAFAAVVSLSCPAAPPSDCGTAPAGTATAGAASPAAAFDRGLFWRVDRPGDGSAPAPSHLFGTVHVDEARAKAFSPALRSALAAARVFMPELLLDDDNQQLFLSATRLPDGQSLSGLLGAAAFESVARRLSGYGVPREVADRIKPWAAYLTLSQPTQVPGEVVDAALIRLASARRLPVRPLETVQQQIAAFEAVPLGSQLALLTELAKSHDQAQAAIPALVDCYLAGDLSGIRQLEQHPGDGSPALQAAMADLFVNLLDRRNRQMLDVLLPALDQGAAFVAVGALHLQGEQGLLALLQRRGWRVQRVE